MRKLMHSHSLTHPPSLSSIRVQTDRPVIGRINLCPGSLSTDPFDFSFQLHVVMHELGHSLGFSSDSWPLFRNPDGSPRTPRNPSNPDEVDAAYQVTFQCQGQSVTQAIAAPSTIAYIDERGENCAWGQASTAASPCVAKFVTSTVAAASQAFFGCDTLEGAELESQDTGSCSIAASHLEQRIFNTDLLCPYAAHAMTVTPVLLAIFQDSGWYTVTWSAADAFKSGLHWGFGQGCAFAQAKCLTPSGPGGALRGQGTPPHFYPSARDVNGGNAVCTIDRLAVGAAEIDTYPSPLPSPYQYWPALPNQGGAPPAVFDFCPAVQASGNALCDDPANAWSGAQYFGSVYGNGSLCLDSSLVWSECACGIQAIVYV